MTMHLWLRFIMLGVFAAAGLSLAVATALPSSRVPAPKEPPEERPAVASVSHVLPAEGKDESPEMAANPASPPAVTRAPSQPTEAATPAPSPVSTASRHAEDTRALLDEALHRWTATHYPPVAKQFDILDQTLKTVQQFQAASEARAQEATRVQSEIAGPAREELPLAPPQPISPEASARGATSSKPADYHYDPATELVTVDAPGTEIIDLLKALSASGGMNLMATPSVTGNVSLKLTEVPVTMALDAVLKSNGYSMRQEGNFLYVGKNEELQKMGFEVDDIGTRVYRPNYVTASELQKLITSMLTPQVGAVTVTTAAEVGIASNKDQSGGDTYAGTDVVVVRDYETVLRQIDQIYQEIDRMPAQVVIEAMILSVRLDDQNTLGVDFELLRNKSQIRLVSGTAANSLATLNFNEGLKVGFLDENLFAFIDALESIGDTNVIASPRVMCLNKQRAEILIGSELGYISTTVTETAATQSVEFLEVGTHLKIRPFISNDGMVRLEVHPELSTGNVRVQQGFTLPDKDVTQVTTNIMCRSGATVVIGGLIREDLIMSSQQIPVLGNLPLVGVLFRQRTEDTERREVIVLLTPRVVSEPEMLAEAQHQGTQFRDRRNAFYDKMQPTNKRRIGEQYSRLALAAWTAGDADVALRYANLAIHFDPLHQSAIDLRQQIITAYPYLEDRVNEHMNYGLAPWQHPVVDYSPVTGVPWRDTEPIPQHIAPLPVEAGIPGPVRTVITDTPTAGP